MTDRAYLHGQKPNGTFKWCAYPCQRRNPDGSRVDGNCRVSVDPAFKGKVWTLSGSPDAPTLSPSIDCEMPGCWHGFIVDGEVRP